MEAVNPALIEQLSRRKLRGSAHDEQRRDKPNLRRLVLIQNSLVSISPCPSPSRTSPGPEDGCDCHNDANQANPTHGDYHHSTPTSIDSEDILYDDDGFGYIFPDLSLYNDEDTDDEDEDDDFVGHSHTEAESDWLDAVLSDLDDEDEMVESHQLASPSAARSSSSSIPIRMIHTPYGSGPRYPLPRPTLDSLPSTSPPSPDVEIDAEEDIEDPAASFDDALPPYFDSDDRSSIYSDESSEPSTPLSHSLLRSGLPSFPHPHHHHHHPHTHHARPSPIDSEESEDHIGVVAHSRHSLAQSYSEARAHGSGLGDDSANRASRAVMNVNPGNEGDDDLEATADVLRARTLLKNAQRQQQQQQQQHVAHDYFSSRNFSLRPFDSY